MKRKRAYCFFVFILISGIAACMPREEASPPAHQETLQQGAPPQQPAREVSLGREGAPEDEEKLHRQLEARNTLLEIARSGDDENVTYVRLTRENEYTDRLPEDLSFTREATSGPGTGKFTGAGFEFAEGSCEDIAARSEGDKPVRWGKRIFKCRSRVLESDWCARRKDAPSETYTFSFLSWTISNEECIGYCRDHDDSTAYIRVKNTDE